MGSKVLHVRVTSELYQKLGELAERENRTLSGYVRNVMEEIVGVYFPVESDDQENVQEEVKQGDLRFAVGDEFTLKGYPFVLYRINAASLVLRPFVPDGEVSARRVMRKMV